MTVNRLLPASGLIACAIAVLMVRRDRPGRVRRGPRGGCRCRQARPVPGVLAGGEGRPGRMPARWAGAIARADPAKAARIRAHVDAQLAMPPAGAGRAGRVHPARGRLLPGAGARLLRPALPRVGPAVTTRKDIR